MLSLLYATGLRLSELLALEGSSVDFGAWLARAGPGRTARAIFLNDETYLALRSYVGRARQEILATGHLRAPMARPLDTLFVTRLGADMTTRTLARILAVCVRRAGIRTPVVSHTLRHSFAVHLIERGVDRRVLRARLGLASMAGTKMYKGHARPPRMLGPES